MTYTPTPVDHVKLIRAFGLTPTQGELDEAEQWEYAQDHQLQGAKDWS
jgi:hypothetical protein